LKNVVMCDRKGAIYEGREGLNAEKAEIAAVTNRQLKKGSLAEMIKGADVFIGVSAPDTVTADMVRSMAKDAILFPMANPTPEIMPDEAITAGAKVVGTGRSDFPNQINNVLAFPGIFRGTLDVRASDINDAMKIAAAKAIASLVSDAELSADYIMPAAFDPRVRDTVASAVAEAARASGVARL
ncbi:MAG: malic enzyme-like NAD(P)-binding protein, partial [Oscillospiraceae bacterium]